MVCMVWHFAFGSCTWSLLSIVGSCTKKKRCKLVHNRGRSQNSSAQKERTGLHRQGACSKRLPYRVQAWFDLTAMPGLLDQHTTTAVRHRMDRCTTIGHKPKNRKAPCFCFYSQLQQCEYESRSTCTHGSINFFFSCSVFDGACLHFAKHLVDYARHHSHCSPAHAFYCSILA